MASRDTAAPVELSVFRTLFESAPGLYLVLKPENFEIVAVSDAYLLATMTRREEILGLTLFEVFPDDPAEPWTDATRNLRASLERVKAERRADAMAVQRYPIPRPKEVGGGFEVRWWSPVNSPVFGPDGELIYIIHRMEDVTPFVRQMHEQGKGPEAWQMLETRAQHMETEIVLRAQDLQRVNEQLQQVLREVNEQQARLVATMEALPVGVWIADADNQIVLTNEAATEIYGGQAPAVRDFAEYGVYQIWWPGTRELVSLEQYPLVRALRGEVVRHMELEHQRFDGTRGTHLASANPIRDADGNIIGAVVTAHDIIKRKQAEDALRESEEQFRALAEATSDVLYRMSADWREIRELKGGKFLPDTKSPTGFWLEKYIDPADKRHVFKAIEEAIRTKSVFSLEHRVRRRDGTLVWTYSRAVPLLDQNGEIKAWFGAASDVTARKQAEEALRQSEEELKRLVDNLERSNRDLQQFAYVASHDLQEPLRQIVAFAQLLEQRYANKLDQTAREYIGLITDGGKRMSSLIQDLLAYSRLESAGGEMRPLPVQEALDQALGNLAAAIQESRATVTNDSLPTVYADKLQLTPVFQNLIGNAIKFRGQEDPVVHVGVKRQKAEWLFCVQDNGIGFPPDYADQIFQIFKRLHGQSRYTGTGIGLTICKRVIERHGGRIWAESEPGKGSTFFFTIPAKVDQE